MNTSLKTFMLSKPEGCEQVPLGTFGYFRARNKGRVYDLVLNEFIKSGLTQADLARRMGKGKDIVCRLLGTPGNWTLNTVSDLLFAIGGGEAKYSMAYPLDEHARNFGTMELLNTERQTKDTADTITVIPGDEVPVRSATGA